MISDISESIMRAQNGRMNDSVKSLPFYASLSVNTLKNALISSYLVQGFNE